MADLKLYTVTADSKLVMIAPLSTIVLAFNLHESAVNRIETEILRDAACDLHFNNRFSFLGPKISSITITR